MAQGLDGMLDGPAVADPPTDRRAGSTRWLVMPLLLAAGWGALLGYSAVFLTEDVPMRPETHSERADLPPPPVFTFPPEPPRVVVAAIPWRDPAPLISPGASLTSAEEAAPVRRVAAIGDEAFAPATTAAVAAMSAERAEYVGTWGPTGAACNAPSRRRGFLPAIITPTGATAGRTICSFRDGRRNGNAWTMAAECSERGRRWSSQVRLVIDGDRLTWSSGKGASSYVRCGRRDG